MKKKITVEQSFCDVCGKEASGYQTCMSCGKEFCYDCMKTQAIEYSHGVYVKGSGDGLYCLDCDTTLTNEADDLHRAYRRIADLTAEMRDWSADFSRRQEDAEKEIEKLLAQKS